MYNIFFSILVPKARILVLWHHANPKSSNFILTNNVTGYVVLELRTNSFIGRVVVINYTGGTYKLKVLKLQVTREEVKIYTCRSCKLHEWKSQVTREKVTIYTSGSCKLQVWKSQLTHVEGIILCVRPIRIIETLWFNQNDAAILFENRIVSAIEKSKSSYTYIIVYIKIYITI